jgi:hypothetical protein
MKPYTYYNGRDLLYPQITDFTKYFGYRRGQVIYENENREWFEFNQAIVRTCVNETVVDEVGYKQRQDAYHTEVSQRRTEFWNDLFDELNIHQNNQQKLKTAITGIVSAVGVDDDLGTYFDIAEELLPLLK